ncbi:MAG: hypothetical protein RLZZ156_1606 [Deinococcota bacterium]|jgi:hypothetical protein
MNRQRYEPPKLDEFQYTQITAGFSFPIGTDALDPMNDFLETTVEEK